MKQYIRDFNRKPIGVMVITKTSLSDTMAIGVSLCHKLDNFDKEKGEQLAIERAKDFVTIYPIKDRIVTRKRSERLYVADQVAYFAKRCLRYYNDKVIILPRIKFQ